MKKEDRLNVSHRLNEKKPKKATRVQSHANIAERYLELRRLRFRLSEAEKSLLAR